MRSFANYFVHVAYNLIYKYYIIYNIFLIVEFILPEHERKEHDDGDNDHHDDDEKLKGPRHGGKKRPKHGKHRP